MYRVLAKISLLTVMMIRCFTVSAQSNKISGVVTDESGPLPGVSILIEGTKTGTVTGQDGRYSLPAQKGQILSFYSMGYENVTITVDERTVYDVVMTQSTDMIDELVVVGYGVQKKVNVTGSVSSVNYSKLADSRPVTSTLSLLQGASSGLFVRQTSGAPGSEGVSMTIRGLGTLNQSSPLVIVDGFEGSLGALDANDIQTISVLKDAASCAIYGNHGANGVVLITTKSAQKGKFNLEYNGIVGYQEPENIYSVVSDYATYMELINEACHNADATPKFSADWITLWREKSLDPNGISESGYPNYVAYPNVDGMRAIYNQQTPIYNRHTLSASGSSERIRFRISASYMDNPGLVENTGYNKFSLRSEVSANITKWLEIGLRAYGYKSKRDAGDINNVYDYAIRWVPCIYPEYEGKYGWIENPQQNSEARNNLYFLNRIQGEVATTYFNVTPYINISLPFGIKSKTSFNYSSNDYQENSYSINREAYSFRTGEVVKSDVSLTDKFARKVTDNTDKWVFETDLSWAETIAGKHDLTAMVGFEAMASKNTSFKAVKKGAQNAILHQFDNMLTPSSISGTGTEYRSASVFGRVTYAYDGRYLAEVNLRYDGSSRFAEKSRWGLFPAISAAWRISKEKFMAESGIDELKIRASWGSLGNNAVGNYAYHALYSSGGSYPFGGVLGGGMISTLSNELLEWETTSTVNAGFELGVFKNRLTVEGDYYYKFTDGILYKPTITATIGMKSSPYMNLCQVSNQGFEFTVGWKEQIGDFYYGVNGNFSRNWNRVEKYKGAYKEGWVEKNGKKVWMSNIGDVSTTGSATWSQICEGHMIGELRVNEVYSGTGQYFDENGNVLPDGGPKDGMIRTPDDLQWLQYMVKAGYTFLPAKTVAKDAIWYGEYILADRNGDGIYGDTNDRQWQNVSITPKFYYGFSIDLGWKGIDFSAKFAGAGGSKMSYRKGGISTSSLQAQETIGKKLAEDHYFYDPENPDDPRTNITSKNPRLYYGYKQSGLMESNHWLFKTDYLKIQNITFGYSLPSDIVKKIHLEGVKIFVSGENLYTFKHKDFPGLDPAFTSSKMYYAPLRQYTVGLNIKF